MVRSMVTKYLVIKDIIHTIEDFKQEMFLSWAIDRNHIKHDLLLSLTNFVVNCFFVVNRFRNQNFFHSHSLDCYYMCNLLIIKGYKSLFGGGEGIATKTFYGNHFTIEGHPRVIFWKIELMEPIMDVLCQALIQVIDSTH